MTARLFALFVPLLSVLAGCATPPPAQAPATPAPTAQTPRPAPATRAAPQAPELKKETLAYLAKRKLTPISGRALNTRANCNFRDENGYRGQLDLAITDAKVEQLVARVDIPKRGSCNFNLTDFRQTESLPVVVLAARQSACKVSLWEQGEQVTMAFRDCHAECSGNSADYLWPILLDSRKGSCS